MLIHGGQKVFVFGVGNVAHMFGQMAIPVAGFTGPLISFVEFLGGIALVAGALTRLAAIGIACDMIGAILFVHIKNGFFNPNGFEFPLLIAGTCIGLALAGGGAASIDGLLTRRRTAASP
jgi:putative oxidoreductase